MENNGRSRHRQAAKRAINTNRYDTWAKAQRTTGPTRWTARPNTSAQTTTKLVWKTVRNFCAICFINSKSKPQISSDRRSSMQPTPSLRTSRRTSICSASSSTRRRAYRRRGSRPKHSTGSTRSVRTSMPRVRSSTWSTCRTCKMWRRRILSCRSSKILQRPVNSRKAKSRTSRTISWSIRSMWRSRWRCNVARGAAPSPT